MDSFAHSETSGSTNILFKSIYYNGCNVQETKAPSPVATPTHRIRFHKVKTTPPSRSNKADNVNAPRHQHKFLPSELHLSMPVVHGRGRQRSAKRRALFFFRSGSIRTSGELGTGDRMAASGAKIWRSQPSRAVDEVRSALSFVTRFSPVIP